MCRATQEQTQPEPVSFPFSVFDENVSLVASPDDPLAIAGDILSALRRWLRARRKRPVRTADFAGRDLSALDLSGLELSAADFSQANLSRADFAGADLTGANFTGATTGGTVFDSATLTGTHGVPER